MEKIIASVIVPAFNAEKTIRQCVKALEAQIFSKEFEIIVVDDGSSDKTSEIAKSFSKVRLLQQKNAGPALARNNGAKKARGEIIIFTDSDCEPKKNWLEEMLKPFSNKGVAGVQGTYKCRQKELVARLIQLEIESSYARMAKQKFIDFIGSYSAAYRKSVFEKLGGFDTSFPIASGEDTDFSFRVHEAGYKMVFRPEANVYHTHPTSLRKYFKIKFFRAFWRTKVYKSHKGKMIKDSYTSQTIKLQLVLFCLFIASLSLPLFGFGWIYTATIFALLFLTGIPFAFWAAKKDLAVGIVFPFIAIPRTVLFSTGFVLGTIRQVTGK